jgi:hypothetical protein
MNRRISRICSFLFAGLFAIAIPFAQASSAQLTGSYQVLRKIDVGQQTRVRLQLHLANHGLHDLRIRRLTVWDSPHPLRSSTRACSLVLHPGASADTTQELIVPRSEYSRWKRTPSLRFLLGVEKPGGRSVTEVIRLDRLSSGKAN